MKAEEVTQQILEAWDEIEQPAEETDTEEDTPDGHPDPEVEESPAEEEESEEPEEDIEEDKEEEDEVVAEEDEEPLDEAETAVVTLLDNPEFRAWLNRYQGDVQRAFEGAFQLEKALGRQGQEKHVLERKLAEAEAALAEAQAFAPREELLSQEQREWAMEAIESGNPSAYVREAIRAGEFTLARAICGEWGQENAFEALRAAQIVDAAEQNFYAAQQAPSYDGPVDHGVLLNVLVNHFPEMPQYEAQMVSTLSALGPNHPLVAEARSPDPEQAARGLIGIYEIARASTHSIAASRDKIQNGNRAASDERRRRAVVSSAGASPAPSEAPRSVKLGPGLTLESLEEEWARNS